MAFNIFSRILLLFCALASTPALSQWQYSSKKIGIDEVPFKFARALSTESLNLEFPYAGRNFAIVTLRINPKGLDVIFSLQKGQLSCHQTCTVKIKVDDKPSRTIAVVGPADSGVNNLLFVMNSAQAQALARELAGASKLAIELPIYKAMGTVVRFDVSGLNLEELGVNTTPALPSNGSAPDKLIQDLQIALNQRGFNAGHADGYMGQQTQAAIIAVQKSLGLTVNGLPSDALLAHLRKSIGGISEGFANNNQAGSSRNDGYGVQIRACIQPGVIFPTPPRSGSSNPAAVYRVQLRPDGAISDVRLTRSSGNPNFDRAVENGLRRCTPFPRPPSGSYPGYIDVNYNMYD
jgi:TonB family protein